MKTTFLTLVLIALYGVALGQTTSREWQAKAVQKYPELGVPDSAFNKRFVAVYNERRKTKPEFFNDSRWPLVLADELNASSASSSTPNQTSLQSAKPDLSAETNLQKVYSFFLEPTHLLVAGLIVIVILFKIFSDIQDFRRGRYLLRKYGDQEVVSRIRKKMFWQGQTEDQLLDSLGYPADTDEKILKSRRRVIWKYRRTGVNRFGLRITVEDGIVVGWDQK